MRIAAHHAALLASPDQPFYVGGYSTGGTLALTHAIESLSDPTLRRPTRVLLVSPAINTRIAVWRVIDALAFLPEAGSGALAGDPAEYDPYKYNSFAVNSTRGAGRRNTLARAIEQAQVAAFWTSCRRWSPGSRCDSTVGARACSIPCSDASRGAA